MSSAPTDFPGPNGTTYQYPNRKAAWLGPVLNSAPAYVTAPSLALSDNTYRAFAQTYATRPNVLYVETTDGALHALNPDFGITGTPPSPSPDLSALQEFFSFLPPAVSPNLAGQARRALMPDAPAPDRRSTTGTRRWSPASALAVQASSRST